MTTSVKLRVAGFGMRSGAGLESLRAALELAGAEVDLLATIAERAEVLRPLAESLGLPLQVTAVGGVTTPTQSARVLQRFGTGSVAEAAALVAAGPRAVLTVLRVASSDGMATCAVAEGDRI
jgi:cobalt-precorrin 5A hydrolase